MITISDRVSFSSYAVRNNYYQKEFAKSLDRLATGYKVTEASDAPGDYVIATNATRELRGIEIANKNASTGQSICAAADESLTKITELAYSIQALANQAIDATDDERASLEDQANEYMEQIKSLKNDTKYNDIEVFRDQGFIFQVGYESDENSSLAVNTSLAASELGGFDIDNYTVDFSDDTAIENEAQTFDQLQADLNKKSIEVGTKASIMGDIVSVQEHTYTNVEDNRGNLINTDVASELVNYVRLEILKQVNQNLEVQASSLNSDMVLELI